MTTITPTASGEITNTCTCLLFEDETGEHSVDNSGLTCFGDCWEFAVGDFENATEELRNNNETNWWRVQNLRLWDGEVSGYFHADTVSDILRGMTVRSEWTMRYEVFAEKIEYSLSHHDAPTGSKSVLTCISDDEREELGLY
jgi:hypothetical protein